MVELKLELDLELPNTRDDKTRPRFTNIFPPCLVWYYMTRLTEQYNSFSKTNYVLAFVAKTNYVLSFVAKPWKM